jgi:hypothetical protein
MGVVCKCESQKLPITWTNGIQTCKIILWKLGKLASKRLILFNEVCDESRDVSEETVANWTPKFSSTLRVHEASDIANDYETGPS